MRTVLLLLVLAAAACSKSDDKGKVSSANTTEQNQGGFTKEQFIQLEVDTDCGWIKASGEPKDREKSRDDALAKLGKTRNDYNLSKGAFMNDHDVRAAIDDKVAACYKAAGWSQVEDPNGEKTWEKD